MESVVLVLTLCFSKVIFIQTFVLVRCISSHNINRDSVPIIYNFVDLTKLRYFWIIDDMHKCKIDMADEIFVINVGGYIDSSTRNEIEYAEAHGKKINYLENITAKRIMMIDSWIRDGKKIYDYLVKLKNEKDGTTDILPFIQVKMTRE